MKLFIKNMVSIRCKMVVDSELQKLGIKIISIKLGEVEIQDDVPIQLLDVFKMALLKGGLELLVDSKSILIEKIKNVIIEMIHYSDELPVKNISEYLSSKLNYNYSYLSTIFTEVKGISIEHFIISHKIERAKEFIVYDDLSLKEIAYKLHYRNVSHLSEQFRNFTGLTFTHFKKMKDQKLRALEDL
ncbi:MAG: helix-turn-helix domain-containing protein [Saprospiraceae bacterium]